ncbi:MAG: haloacid dehalogenase-like hydrolase [Phycisphaeraceae bacterium]|nr:haloacid dehalogenase-like hydrolase [Phycisphaeraceae bacterium]MCW5762332.1 haloacid dehalogenase-like hydrolase [Phycisphaeraceae bacterium]
MLILFDIDMTLLTTDGAGMAALGEAGRELFGSGFDETRTDYGGRLDPVIITNLLIANGQDVTLANCTAMRAGYRKHLEKQLASRTPRALPGVYTLVGRLSERSDLTLGLLTGNFQETGLMKLASSGLDAEPFVLNVWGDESPHTPPQREHLPAVAIERYRAWRDADLQPERVVIIGDTVHDVSCAIANGCRVLGVATGHATADQLSAAGAHKVLPDLSNTMEVLAWLKLN